MKALLNLNGFHPWKNRGSYEVVTAFPKYLSMILVAGISASIPE
ncbi:MAG: hypothetical protein C5S44_00765 [Candidatus Methanocomedens sp.]|jgi:hypothetical protein|nr:MAG: hypothetical protein C5S45_02225 [ANME-2 cluster archaeon]KAF5425006.1 MAG: hypothetical protein C5S44_00765 [ANME-2 cluster archaeon]